MDPNHPLSQGLVGFWLFNETGGLTAYDLSGNLNHGTLTNGPIWSPGRSGQALSLDGTDDYVNVPDNSSLDIASNFTLSSWVNYTTSGGTNARTVFAKDNALVGEGYGLYLDYQNNAIPACYARIGGSWVSAKGLAHNNGRWHHIVGVYDGSNLNLYVDCVKEANSAATGTVTTNSDPLQIGHFNTGPSGTYFLGLTDDVRVYNRALSPQEIRWLYEYPYDNLIVEPLRKFWLMPEAEAPAAGQPYIARVQGIPGMKTIGIGV
jgi:hypothetical protein